MSRWRKGWMLIFALSAVLLLTVDSSLMTDAAYLTLLPLILGFLFLLKKPDYDGSRMWKKENREPLFMSLVLSLLFILMLSATQILGSGLYSWESLKVCCALPRALLYRVFTLSLYPAAVLYGCILLFFQLLTYGDFGQNRVPGEDCRLHKIKYIGIYRELIPVALLILAYLLCSFPNYMLADSFMCWDQAVAGEWSDWDPIGYIFFLRLCSEIWDSFWIVRIIQSILYLYICNGALGLMARLTGSVRACRLYVLVSSLVLTPYIYLQLTYKDVLFTMCLFAFSLNLLDCVTKEGLGWKNVAAYVGFGLVVILFRHGSIVPLLLGTAALLGVLLFRGRKKDASLAAGGLAAVFAMKLLVVNLLAFQILDATRNPGYVTYTLPMVLAGAMASDTQVELTEDEKTVMEIITPLERWRECYASTGNGYWSDPIARDWSMIGEDIRKIDEYDLGEALLRLNFSLFRRYPARYLTVFFNCNSLVWEMGRPSDGYEWAPVEGTCFEFQNGYPSEEEMPRTAMTNVMLQLSNASSRLPIVRSFTWRGGLWTFGLILAVVLLLRKRRFGELAACIPVLTVLAMLMLSIPAQDPRYVLGGVECGTFFLVYAMFVGKRSAIEAPLRMGGC